MSIASPPSSLRRAATCPPIASTRPRTTARPMPVPAARPVAGPRRRGRTSRRAAAAPASGTPGPESSTVSAHEAVARPVARRDPDLASRGRPWRDGVVEQVDQRLARAARGSPADERACRDGRPPPAGRRGARSRSTSVATDQVLEVERLVGRAERPALDPAQVEQVADEPVQSFGLAVDRGRALARASPALTATSGSISVPADGRIVASGVRRSCETDSSSAVLSASLWRATSARRALRGEPVVGEGLRRPGRRRPRGAASSSGPARRESRCADRPDRAERRPPASIRTRKCARPATRTRRRTAGGRTTVHRRVPPRGCAVQHGDGARRPGLAPARRCSAATRSAGDRPAPSAIQTWSISASRPRGRRRWPGSDVAGRLARRQGSRSSRTAPATRARGRARPRPGRARGRRAGRR